MWDKVGKVSLEGVCVSALETELIVKVDELNGSLAV